MKKALLTLLLPVILVALSLVWFYQNTKSPSTSSEKQDFLITRGSSASTIGNKLEKEGLVKSSLAFKIYVQLTGSQRSILAGEFSLSPNYSLFKIVDELKKGPTELWVTVPEGLRREEVVEKFITGLSKKGQDAENFRKEFLEKSSQKEGFLFPDTYLFPKDASAPAVAAKMLAIFEVKVDAKMREDIGKSGYILNEIITMASILERETITEEEKPVVSGILFKRLEAGWALQADATLQYAVANAKCPPRSGLLMLNVQCESRWEPITKADLEIKSLYNTYKYSGLPPAPIASPGLSSIKAAIYPQESPYWYYLHDSEGKIHYAETLEEHNENVRVYLGK